ncbi:hypothetical protein ABIE21_000166 [Conyzicola nivalis]|uniref:Uncharacterized protein n=1 Tax=Conyzicola nivalis TaxID=1477021 RepID=A0ABV2QI06_9MICO
MDTSHSRSPLPVLRILVLAASAAFLWFVASLFLGSSSAAASHADERSPLDGVASLVGSVTAPVTAAVTPVVATPVAVVVPVVEAVAPVAAPVVSAAVSAPVAAAVAPVVKPAATVVSTVTAPAAPVVTTVVAPVLAPVVATLTPVVGALAPAVAPLAPVVAPLAPVLGPVIAPLAPVLGPVVAPLGPVLGPVVAPLTPAVDVLTPLLSGRDPAARTPGVAAALAFVQPSTDGSNARTTDGAALASLGRALSAPASGASIEASTLVTPSGGLPSPLPGESPADPALPAASSGGAAGGGGGCASAAGDDPARFSFDFAVSGMRAPLFDDELPSSPTFPSDTTPD